MSFTHDWFSLHIGNWTRWLGARRDVETRALEIGCYEGKATCWLLENILTHPKSTITCIDTFEGSDEHKEFGVKFGGVERTFHENTAPWENKVTTHKGRSDYILRRLAGPFDLVYIDGSHRAPDVLTDAVLAWPLVAPGGIVVFDDYMWDHYPDATMNPRLGVDSFLATFKGQFALIASEYQVCVRKQ